MSKSGFEDIKFDEPEFDFNAAKHHKAVDDILNQIYKEIEDEKNGTPQETR